MTGWSTDERFVAATRSLRRAATAAAALEGDGVAWQLLLDAAVGAPPPAATQPDTSGAHDPLSEKLSFEELFDL